MIKSIKSSTLHCARAISIMTMLLGLLLSYCTTATAQSLPGLDWTSGTGAPDNSWKDVAFGAGRFVAVSDSGSDRLMTSTDGIAWSTGGVSGLPSTNWTSVAYGNGRFVAVAFDATVATSTDGLTWSASGISGNPGGIGWERVRFLGGKFVAVGQQGTASDRAMSSPDGLAWTSGGAAGDSVWHSVSYGNGVYVAVASSSTTSNLVMTSTDALTWTGLTSVPNQLWWNVTFGGGRFVAVAADSTGSQLAMTSANGSAWLQQTTPGVGWRALAYGNGLFVAAGTGTVMTSSDGSTWTSRSSAAANSWLSTTYAPGIFVTVGDSGTGNRTMYSGTLTSAVASVNSVSPDHGPAAGGTVIQINGAGFIPGATVSIGPTECTSVDVTSSSTLTCTTGAASAGTNSVSVTNAGQQPATLTNGFRYDAPARTRQTPAPGAVRIPKHLKHKGLTRLTGAKPKTTDGTPITVHGQSLRGDLRLFRIVKKHHMYFVRTYGVSGKIRLTWKAAGNATLLPYRFAHSYPLR